MNTRSDVQDGVEEEFASLILQYGVLAMFRGVAIAVETESANVYHMISAGSMVNAFYIAHGREPDNPNILATMSAGLENVLLLKRETVGMGSTKH